MSWPQRIGIATILLVALGLAGFHVFERQIGEALFERVIARNIARDPAAELPDGLHVYMCGTGSPMPDTDRAGPCIGVLAGDRAFIFDVGSGSIRTLGAMGFPLRRLDHVYLTHLHSDHFDGLGELLVQAWVGGGRTMPLPISGPQGTIATVAGFNAAYRTDGGYRIAHHGEAVAHPAGYGGAGGEIVLPEGAGSIVVLQEGELTITAFGVSHDPVESPFGYRIDYRGRSIAISGDTIYDPNLVAASRGVDILFHEALQPRMVRAMENGARIRGAHGIAKILADIPSYHATPQDAARAASEAGARQLVFYHMIPPLASRLVYPMFLDGVREIFPGPVRIADDGLLISLLPDSETIDFEQLLK